MQATITLDGTLRTPTKTKGVRDLRREEQVPCNLYGGESQIHFSAAYNDFQKLIFTDQFHRVEVKVDGKSYLCIVKDIQFHPVTDKIVHIDFQELTEGRKVITDIPVRTTGFAAGVREGGQLRMKVRKLTVKSLPKDLPNFIELDVTELELGKAIRVRDIEVPNVQFMNSEGIPVVQVDIPRALRGGNKEEDEAAPAAAEGGEAPAEASAEG